MKATRRDRRTEMTILAALSYLSDWLDLGEGMPSTPYNEYFQLKKPLTVRELKKLESQIARRGLRINAIEAEQ